MATNPAVRVPEPSVESSASGVHWGAITAGALGAVGITFSKSRTGFGACYRFAVVTIRLSSKSFWYRRGNLADRDSMVGIRLGGLSCRPSTREMGGHSNRRGAVPRHRTWISCLGFSDFNRRNATYHWIINDGCGCARDDGRFGLSRGCRSGSKGRSCIRVL